MQGLAYPLNSNSTTVESGGANHRANHRANDGAIRPKPDHLVGPLQPGAATQSVQPPILQCDEAWTAARFRNPLALGQNTIVPHNMLLNAMLLNAIRPIAALALQVDSKSFGPHSAEPALDALA